MADDLVIFHNPSCSKSRQTLGILQEAGIEPEIVLYKQAPPDRATLERIVAAVDVEPARLVRRDPEFKEAGLTPADIRTGEQVVEVLLAHPALMERPIVVKGDRVVLGRPPENVESLLG
jgi:arsenate reductase (glutaredoxin)